MKRNSFKLTTVATAGIMLLALSLRIWGITFGLPGLDHGDEPEVVNHAVRFGSGDFNPHRFQYGSLFQYILFIFYGIYFLGGYSTGAFTSVHQFALSFVQDPSVFYLIARFFSALLGTATVYLVYLIGRNCDSRQSGLLGAFFLAIGYEHTIHSHYCTVDVALVFFYTLALYRCLKLYETEKLRDYVFAGLCVGFAVAVKFNGIFAALPLLAAHFLRRNGPLWVRVCSRRLWAAIFSVLIGHALTSPFFYMDFGSALKEIRELSALHAGASSSLLTYLKILSTDVWGLPLGALCLVGLLQGLNATRKHFLLVIGALSVILFASGYHYVEGKYILPALPLLAVLAASTLWGCCSRQPTIRFWITLALLTIHPLSLIITWDRDHARTSLSIEAKQWIEQNVPVNTKILLDNVGNDGPKLENSPANYTRQYEKAAQHQLLKSDYLKLKAELKPKVYYDIVLINCAEGSTKDDYEKYRLWEDLEEIGHSAQYYRERGFHYIIVTNRYFSKIIDKEFLLIKEFRQGAKSIRIYKISPSPA